MPELTPLEFEFELLELFELELLDVPEFAPDPVDVLGVELVVSPVSVAVD